MASILEIDIDTLFLSETWFFSSLPDAPLLIPSYTLFRNDRSTSILSSTGGGVAAYVKNSILPSVSRLVTSEPHNLENICLRYSPIKSSTTIASPTQYTFHYFYRPPHHTTHERDMFFQHTTQALAKHQSHQPLFVLGDFNAKLSQWNCQDPNTTEGTMLSSALDDLGLIQLMKDIPTRYSPTGRTKPSLLDLVITNNCDFVHDIRVLPPLSDHCPVLFTTPSAFSPTTKSSHIYIPDYARTNFDALREHLWEQPLLECMEGAQTIESAWFSWCSYFNQSTQLHVPMRKIGGSKIRMDKPWFTADLFKLRKKKDRLFRAAQRRNTVQNWVGYKMARNLYQSALRKQKASYFCNLSEELSERDPYQWWKRAKRLANIPSRPSNSVPELVSEDGSAYTDPEKAQLLASAFSRQCNNVHSPDRDSPPFEGELFDIPPLTCEEVFVALRHLPSHKASGGTIPNRLLKETAGVITKSLTRLFNLSLSLGQLPSEWKLSTVIPLFKQKGLPSDPVNYRPISLLPSLAKVLDYLVCQHLTTFLYTHRVITPAQYGFVRQRSTADQLVVLTSTIAASLDKGDHYESLFLDFAKAFDRVPHQVLLSILCTLCRPSSLAWFSNYLSNRQLTVRVGSSLSTPHPIQSGVPQGSHLGPILFLLYINTLSNALELPHTPLLFADDTVVSCPVSSSSSDSVSPLQSGVDRVMRWAQSVGGSFNPEKSVHMTFRRPRCDRRSPSPTISMMQVQVPQTTVHRHLGVFLDSTLTLSSHIEKTIGKFRQRVILLSYMAKYLTPSIIDRLYKGYVRPVAEYASPLWQPRLTVLEALTLERLQARVARQFLYRRGITLPDHTPKEEICQLVNWPSLSWRRHIHSMRLFHHFFHHHPKHLQAIGYELSMSQRRPNYILVPVARTHTKSSILFVAARCWNTLPPEIRSIIHPRKFIMELKTHFANSCYSNLGFL